MRIARFCAAAAVLLAWTALAGAQDSVLEQPSVLDQPVEKEGWPIEITRRPLTLARGMAELTVPVGVNLSEGSAAKPVFVSPSLYYGVTPWVTVGLRHFLGLCLTGSDNGCPHVYNDLSIDSVWRLLHGGVVDLAFGAALNAAPISNPFTLSGEVRLIARVGGGPVAVAIAPTFNFGLTERDSAPSKTYPLAFPLATYAYGWYEQTQSENKEVISIPATLTFQVMKAVAVSLAAALHGPLNPSTGDFGDFYRIPMGAAVVVSPTRAVDVGASFTFLNLLGRSVPGVGRWDQRALQGFAAFRF
jgi:hypothetical protein